MSDQRVYDERFKEQQMQAAVTQSARAVRSAEKKLAQREAQIAAFRAWLVQGGWLERDGLKEQASSWMVLAYFDKTFGQ